MTDRELLELAAKASGIEFGVIHDSPRMRCEAGWTPWNPLTDDGDALRLAVKLGMVVDAARPWVTLGNQMVTNINDGSDCYAATRRAIVRAAAEIGRSME